MAGYLAELSNPLLNMRWWLMQTLEVSGLQVQPVQTV
jgi:hypothetical protein